MGCRWGCCRVAIRHLPACEAHILSVSPSFDTTTARECPKNKDGQEQRRRGLTRLVYLDFFFIDCYEEFWYMAQNSQIYLDLQIALPSKKTEGVILLESWSEEIIVVHFLFSYMDFEKLFWLTEFRLGARYLYMRQFRAIILSSLSIAFLIQNNSIPLAAESIKP